MLTWLISILWGLVPTRLALAIWRLAPAGDLQLAEHNQAGLPAMGKNAPWTQKQALAYRLHAECSRSMSPDDEKLIRLIEVRKGRFFDGVPCAPAAVLASTLADLGDRHGDLRPINTALKLRDMTVGSFPPLRAIDRALFRAADRKLESVLNRLERSET